MAIRRGETELAKSSMAPARYNRLIRATSACRTAANILHDEQLAVRVMQSHDGDDAAKLELELELEILEDDLASAVGRSSKSMKIPSGEQHTGFLDGNLKDR